MMSRILIALFVALVVLVECVVAYLLIPSTDEVARAAQQQITAETRKLQAAEASKNANDEDAPAMEVKLGRFNVTLHQPASNTTLHINFTLAGTVKETDQSDFHYLFANNQHRWREKVLLEIRSAKPTDLTEPGLGLIKRRILETSNALFGRPLLTSVVFSEFTFHEA